MITPRTQTSNPRFNILAPNPVRAALMMVAASSLIAITTLLAKVLGLGSEDTPLHPLQITAGRFFFALMALAFFFLLKRFKISAPDYRIHFSRSFLGWLGVTLMFASVNYIPISDAISISFMNPIISMFIAIPFLHERIGRLRWVAALISFMGALILLRPGLESFQWAAFFALGAALCFGFESILIKKLSHTESPLQILTLNNIIGCILSLTVASLVWTNPSSTQWFQLAALGVIMVSAQALFIQSMKRSDASYALPFLYITLVFASVYDYFIFTTHPDWVSVLGAMTIVSGALLLGIGESVRKERGKGGSVK